MKKYKKLIGAESREAVDRYISSFEFDRALAKYIAMVLIAHVKQLARLGYVKKDTAKTLVRELTDIMNSDGEKVYEWARTTGELYEDFFEAIELYLYNVVGSDAGRIALGRSRNDHIAAVLRLAIRDRVLEIATKILDLRRVLLDKASMYSGTLFPFFTHAQIAQCGSASIFFLTYEQAFADVFSMLMLGLHFLNQNPLGSGAAAGTFVEFDRNSASRELCLSSDLLPPYYATGSRIFILYMASVLSIAMTEVGRFAEDMMLLTNVVGQGIAVPKHHISTSSIMPHKRNLVTLEIARAKSSASIGMLAALLSIYKSVPYGYNLDFQEANTQIFDVLNDAAETLEILRDFIEGLELEEEAIRAYVRDKPCWSSDLIELIAVETGKPLRDLYAELARVLHMGAERGGSSLDGFLGKYGIKKDDLLNLYKRKPIEKRLKELLEYASARLQKDLGELERLRSLLIKCNEMLISDSL